MGTFIKRLGLLIHRFSSIIITLFLPSRETLFAGRVKLFAEASELFTYAVFQLVVVVHKTACSKCNFQGG